MKAIYLHRVDVWKSPGGRDLNGGCWGGRRCKAAHAQAGADTAVHHLQTSHQIMLQLSQPHLMYAHMQAEAHSILHAQSGRHAGSVHGIRSSSTRRQLFSVSGTQAMAPAEVASGLHQADALLWSLAVYRVQGRSKAMRHQNAQQQGGQVCTWICCSGSVSATCAAAVNVRRPPTAGRVLVSINAKAKKHLQ